MAGKKIGGGRIDLSSVNGAVTTVIDLLLKLAAGETTLSEAAAKVKQENEQTKKSMTALADEAGKVAGALKEATSTLHEKTKALNEAKNRSKTYKKRIGTYDKDE